MYALALVDKFNILALIPIQFRDGEVDLFIIIFCDFALPFSVQN